MIAELKRTGYLSQDVVAYELYKKFGSAATYMNDNGNLAISKEVLSLFKKMTGTDVIWSRSDRAWRFRQAYDKPGRQQD